MTITIPSRGTTSVQSESRVTSVRSVSRVLRRIPATILAVFLGAIVIVPMLWMVLSSFKTQGEFLSGHFWELPQSWNLDNYVEAWTRGRIAEYFTNTAVTVLPALFVGLLIGAAAGFALQVLVWKGRSAVLLIFLAGIMVPVQMTLLPLFTIYFQTGLTGTLWPLFLTYTADILPLTVFLLATYFRAIPREIFEAATMDGASLIRSFFSIGLPMIRNALFTVGLVQFFFLWNDLLLALTFVNSSDLRTLQVGLLNFAGEYGSLQYGPLFAAICLNVGVMFFVYLLLNQQIQKGLVAGSVKG
ncbi:carbohydrate ABC transporter permease [Agromyces albus]|uniref:carbohydrate ABC transporter permease n=1 Tax=Agromyces albus TaxID=205332 RepID=UPI00277E72CA|nr:carbohydrate ABC transporter permease [Agromyces albus]MDQ0577223.1 raffinose/stachyose/melibiose transport system permease protein [Agromyces albus]